MLKGTKQYNHPSLGEIWIAKGSVGYELLSEKKHKALNAHIEQVWASSGIKKPAKNEPAQVEQLC